VDNSPGGYFRADAAVWVKQASCPVVYVHEPVPNIALARNAGCRTARGNLIAFIDDDERADPLWLSQLLRTLEEWDADAVAGPVSAEFEDGKPPAWDPLGSHFGRSRDLKRGAQIEVAATNNLLIRRSTCLLSAEPFDTRYGRTGGSDTAFTYFLTRHGRKIVWCPDAVVREFVPLNRARIRFQLVRLLAQTRNFVRIQLQHESPSRAVIRGGWLIAKGLALVLRSLPSTAASFFAPEERIYHLRAPLFYGLGLMIWPIGIWRY
jgi:succinoglycan biosynthesis protein ExoM